jgi:peroxiredoxin Q/BCP
MEDFRPRHFYVSKGQNEPRINNLQANTPGCTKQACGFRDKHVVFEQAGFKIFALSADSPKSQSNWKTKQNLPYTLLCDPKREAIAAFGAASAGKTIRSHIVVEKGGRVRDVQIKISPAASVDLAEENVTK